MDSVGLSDVLQERNLSIRGAAALIGCSHTAVQNWIADADAPSLRSLSKVARALDLSPAVVADLRLRATEWQVKKGAA